MPKYNGQIGYGWYEENEEDIKHQELQEAFIVVLKQKLDDVFGIISDNFRDGEIRGIRGTEKLLKGAY